jgi:hypothetical protein
MNPNPNNYAGWILGQNEYEAILHAAWQAGTAGAFEAASRYMLNNYGWIQTDQRIVLANAAARAVRGAETFNAAGQNYQLRPSQVADNRRMQEYAANKLGRPLDPNGAMWQYDVQVNIVITWPSTGNSERRSIRTYIDSRSSLSKAQVEERARRQVAPVMDRNRNYQDGRSVVDIGVEINAVRLGY